jgi:2'-5' RNA ligase
MRALYFIAILPPEEVNNQIEEIRLECSRKFGVFKALRPPVHITLYPPFHLDESCQANLERLIGDGTMALSSFTQHLENYGSFARKVVYIDAVKNTKLEYLYQAILSVIARNKIDRQLESRINQPYNPHITIAYRDVSNEQFAAIWNEYKDRKLELSFEIERFTLLKHEKQKWVPVRDFELVAP